MERARHCRECGNFDAMHGELLAELERLHSWAGLMELLDEHWPEDIFPTVHGDDERRDAGVRIVSLLRWVDQLRAAEAKLAAIREVCAESDDERFMREISRGFDGNPLLPHLVKASAILAILDGDA